jgi:CRISPR/Cas system-associated endonuclease Cas3-HD
MGGIVEGWIVEGDVVRVYEPIAISLSDIGKALDYYGEAFWKAEERLLSKKMAEAYAEEKPPAD